ncbi:MAG: tRNA uridine-5-carboxymethylaminomethyl(34) synthesis GTPase MnmE [Paenibacillaceae bacterium]
MVSDTITAISTPVGEGGISVIRVSGPDSIHAVEQIFESKHKLSEALSHTVHYGYIKSCNSQERIEEVLVTIMRAPRSFTMEDIVEIGCHGGLVSVKQVLNELLLQDVRLAEPGEFTKRAFLNGRIDLTQAEAVIDLIRAKSDRAFKIALKQVEGALSLKIKKLRHDLVGMMAHIEVNIDYPEHDVENLTHLYIKDKSVLAIDQLDLLLKAAHQGKIIREGIVTAIIGRPNVGKSSLLNTLAQDNKAIVTEIPGTTRDVIEEYVTINGIPLKLLDTAGIRETSDIVEKIGVERSKVALTDADLILLMFNAGEPLQQDDYELLDLLKDRKTIIVVNKMDLPLQIELPFIYDQVPLERVVMLSLQENEGIEQLEKAISTLFFNGELESNDFTYVSNVRHIHLLTQAKRALHDALEATEIEIPIDIIQIDIRTAWELLGEIIGDTAGDSLIDKIFSQFCLGK